MKSKELVKMFTKAEKNLEEITGKSFYGGGMMKYKNMLGFLDGITKDDTVCFQTHSGFIQVEDEKNEEYKFVLMLIGKREKK